MRTMGIEAIAPKPKLSSPGKVKWSQKTEPKGK